MKKIILFLLISNSFISCVSVQNKNITNKETEYWNKKPDLSKIAYEGGDGKSIEKSIIIKFAVTELDGVAAEYAYISKIHGIKFSDWKPVGQSTITEKNQKYDLVKIQTITKNEIIEFYFNITEFYGKF